MKGRLYRDASQEPSKQMWIVIGQRHGMIEVMSLDGTGTERDISIEQLHSQLQDRKLIRFELKWEKDLSFSAQYDFFPVLEEK